MVLAMDGHSIIEKSAGINQSGIRDHNERLILSILQFHQAVPAAELARRTGLSKPTSLNHPEKPGNRGPG